MVLAEPNRPQPMPTVVSKSPKLFGGDHIFAAVDARADDIVDAERHGGKNIAFVPQADFDSKAPIPIDGIGRIEMRQAGIAE